MAHFGFVHEGWLGDRAHTALADYRIEPTRHGFAAVGCRAWQPQSNRLSSEGGWVDYRYEVTAPRESSPAAAFQVIEEARTAVSNHWSIDWITD